MDWKKIISACEWGLFFGIVTWLMATGITNDITSAGVWGIIFSRILTGLVIATVPLRLTWWIRGIIWGTAVNLFFVLLVRLPLGDFTFGWKIGWHLMVVSGAAIGVLLEIALRYREKQIQLLEKKKI
jgi:hypothetical protein